MDPALALLRDLVAIDSVNPSLVPGGAGEANLVAHLERVTFNDTFDGFPMFSPDGRKLVFASNRNGAKRGETNLFVADWVE